MFNNLSHTEISIIATLALAVVVLLLLRKFALLIKVALSIVLIVLVVKFSDLDIHETINQLKQTHLFWFIGSILMFAVTVFTNTYRWMILARLLDYKLDFRRSLRMYFESMFSNNFLPTNFGGDAIRAYDLGRHDKSWLKAASTVLMERFFGFTMMFALIPVALLIMRFTSYQGVVPQEIRVGLWLSFVATVLGILSYKLWSKIPWDIVQKVNYAIKEYTKCKHSLKRVIFWTFITHVFLLLGNACTALAIGVGIDQIPLWYWFIITPAATLASFIIPAMKGVGAKEASYIYFLSLIGIQSDQSLAIAFIAFVSTLVCSLPGVSIAFRKMKVQKIIKEEQEHEHEQLEEVAG